jgi:hypothetical protein
MIALETAGDYVFPCFCASLYNGNNMVERQVFSGTLFPAVLAGMVIPGVDVRPAELGTLKVLSDLYILEESEDARHSDGEADASDFAIVFGENLHFTLAKQIERPFPGYNIDGFITRI